MAIKGGDLIHTGNLVLIDRAQTAGPGQVNINSTKIYELGNYYSLATVYDTPDLTFSLDSFDASAEFEALLLNKKFSKANGTQSAALGGSPTGGTFTLTYGGQTTATIAYNATAAAVQAALVALSNLNAGDVSVSGDDGGPYTVTFSPAFLAANTVPVMTASATGLTPSGTVSVSAYDGIEMAEGTALNPAASVPMDVVSAFKPGLTAAAPYDVLGSVAIPYLQLETLSYRFGISDNASQNATLRGDSIFYTPSSTYVEVFAGTNTAGQTLVMAHPAVVYHGDKVNQAVVDGTPTKATRYALSVALASGKRLLPGADYQESVTGSALTVTLTNAVPVTDQVRVIYASTDVAVYPQVAHAPVAPTRPAAIRGRDVEVYIGGTNLADRWTSVQQVTIDWRVTLEKDEEMGNAQAVSQTFDVPEVSGTVDLKPRDYQELYRRVCITAGVTPGEVAGAVTTTPLSLLVKLHSPEDGSVLKTLFVPDARFTLPGYSGQAGQGQKLTVTFNWSSDSGALLVYKGDKLA